MCCWSGWRGPSSSRALANGDELAREEGPPMTEANRSKTSIILDDPPYGTERSCNGLRRASALSKGEDDEVRIFLVTI